MWPGSQRPPPRVLPELMNGVCGQSATLRFSCHALQRRRAACFWWLSPVTVPRALTEKSFLEAPVFLSPFVASQKFSFTLGMLTMKCRVNRLFCERDPFFSWGVEGRG